MIIIPESKYDVKQLFEEAGCDIYSLEAYAYFWKTYDEWCRREYNNQVIVKFNVNSFFFNYDEQSPKWFMKSDVYGLYVPDDWKEMSEYELTQNVLKELKEYTDAIATSKGILYRVCRDYSWKKHK